MKIKQRGLSSQKKCPLMNLLKNLTNKNKIMKIFSLFSLSILIISTMNAMDKSQKNYSTEIIQDISAAVMYTSSIALSVYTGTNIAKLILHYKKGNFDLNQALVTGGLLITSLNVLYYSSSYLTYRINQPKILNLQAQIRNCENTLKALLKIKKEDAEQSRADIQQIEDSIQRKERKLRQIKKYQLFYWLSSLNH
jgi:hypothetical protein